LTRLETAHSHSLRRILGVSLIDRHRLTYIRQACDTEPIKSLVAKRSMQWLGHVMRMPASRLPRKTFDCTMEVARGVGRPPACSRHYFHKLLTQQLHQPLATALLVRMTRSCPSCQLWTTHVDASCLWSLFGCLQSSVLRLVVCSWSHVGVSEGLPAATGGMGSSHAATSQSPPCRHRAAAAPLRPTAENCIGWHRECVVRRVCGRGVNPLPMGR
jgi:hypothetical protein